MSNYNNVNVSKARNIDEILEKCSTELQKFTPGYVF